MTGEENRRMVYRKSPTEESRYEDSHEKGNIAPAAPKSGIQGPRDNRVQTGPDAGSHRVRGPVGKRVRGTAQGPLAPAGGAPGGGHCRQNAPGPSPEREHAGPPRG